MVSLRGNLILKDELKVIERVDLLASHDEAIALVESLYKRSSPVVLSFVNAHAYNLCCTDVNFSQALLKSDIIFRDGIGMQILYKSIRKDPGVNLNGTDYIPELMDRYRGKKIALLGTNAVYLRKASEKLSLQGHKIVLTETGFHPMKHYLSLVKDSAPEMIIIGMGMPKQEQLAILLRESIGNSCLIINGGAILDFFGNKIYRAPIWVRRLKMEWFFRLCQEPTRLFSRYVIGNYVFLKRTRQLKKHYVRRRIG